MADVSNQQIHAWLDTTRDKWEYMFWVNWPFKMYLTGGEKQNIWEYKCSSSSKTGLARALKKPHNTNHSPSIHRALIITRADKLQMKAGSEELFKRTHAA